MAEIQPSGDAKSTAIAVAYAIALFVPMEQNEAGAKKSAKLVSELAATILAGVSLQSLSARQGSA
jgi:hypothetical protein